MCDWWIITLLGENGSKLDKLRKTDFQNFRGAFEKVLQRERNKNPPRSIRSLKAHSRWLSEFHGSKFDEQLEIPGQYSGKAKPDPAAHAKIISFDERLLPQHSLRRPKRLTMNGSDERQHNFLVKVRVIFYYMSSYFKCMLDIGRRGFAFGSAHSAVIWSYEWDSSQGSLLCKTWRWYQDLQCKLILIWFGTICLHMIARLCQWLQELAWLSGSMTPFLWEVVWSKTSMHYKSMLQARITGGFTHHLMPRVSNRQIPFYPLSWLLTLLL